MLELISGWTQPNGRVQLEPPHTPLLGALGLSLVGGSPSPSATINRGGGRGARYEVHHAASFLADKTLGRSRGCAGVAGSGAAIELSAPPLVPPSSTPRHHHDASAPPVTAREQISTKEPEMAGSSSSTGDGHLSSPFLISLFLSVLAFRSRTSSNTE